VLPELREVSPGTRPRRLARLTGAFFLITIVCGVVAEAVISQRLVVSGDAAATVRNILAHEPLYRLGFTVYLVEMMAQVATAVLFYFLLRPAGPRIALAGMVFELVGCTIKTVSRLFYFAPLLVLGGSAPAGYDAAQREGLSMLLLQLNNQGAGMALPFFGLASVLTGYLVYRSGFLPRFLGVIGMAGGIGWLTFVSPLLGMQLFPVVAAVGILGALATILWLLVAGVNEARWYEKEAIFGGSA
jgi:hypothetical protein